MDSRVSDRPDILVLETPIAASDLKRLVETGFVDMVKFVADIERGVIAIGGQLHADAEEVLLETGSRQADLWGANYYPERAADERVEYTSLINIRPASGNPGMEIQDEAVRERVRDLARRLIGEGTESA